MRSYLSGKFFSSLFKILFAHIPTSSVLQVEAGIYILCDMNQVHDAMHLSIFLNHQEEAVVNDDENHLADIKLAHS